MKNIFIWYFTRGNTLTFYQENPDKRRGKGLKTFLQPKPLGQYKRNTRKSCAFCPSVPSSSRLLHKHNFAASWTKSCSSCCKILLFMPRTDRSIAHAHMATCDTPQHAMSHGKAFEPSTCSLLENTNYTWPKLTLDVIMSQNITNLFYITSVLSPEACEKVFDSNLHTLNLYLQKHP